METKICTRCKEMKSADIEHFGKDDSVKSGWSSWCRTCYNAHASKRYQLINIPPKKQGSKTCTKCKTEKKRPEFNPNKSTSDGRSSWCKSCHAEKSKQYEKIRPYDPAKIKIRNAKYQSKHKDEIKKYQRSYHHDYICDPIHQRKQMIAAKLSQSEIQKPGICSNCSSEATKIYAYLPERFIQKTMNVRPLTLQIIIPNINWMCSSCMLKNRKRKDDY